MKKITAIVLFFCCNALLIFFEVHKQGLYLELNYQIQKLQTKLHTLNKEKNELTYQVYSLQQPNALEKSVKEDLGMKNIELKSIKVLEEL